ncbi:MAG: hypothetical protein VX733_12195 [Candidatus Latescibacterota bacterium]|nr:hypothetical protein [Candidatus Latescibacterota bacterium]
MLVGLVLTSAWGCSYHYVAGPLRPTETQGTEMTIADDGGVTFTQGRLEVRLRPVTADELNRQFAAVSATGQKSTNPYTYGDTEFWDGMDHTRFTVFQLSVKNYEHPKVQIDPVRVELLASNSRQYWSLNLQQLDTYYRAYAIGYRGNEYSRYQDRVDLLRRTMFNSDPVFSGQETEGFIVFPALHSDVESVQLIIHDASLRFDFRNEPLEQIDISYAFEREIGKTYWGQEDKESSI